ncbi:hypothetical protein T02_4421 [Trichinella nativa]|uniref:Uncharacterized protein n=1 Tax=Trichinella nativa TaxID=6335 RepID=A0A0V1KPB0_9BILA|nr:hypothetical protein T02_4421 [Trichinella nativa]
MPSGKRETERKGNASPNSDGRTINTVEEADEPARGSDPLPNLYRFFLWSVVRAAACYYNPISRYLRRLCPTTVVHYWQERSSALGSMAFLFHILGRSITTRLTFSELADMPKCLICHLNVIRHKGPFIRYGSLCYVMGCDPFSEGRYSVRLLRIPDAALSVANELKTAERFLPLRAAHHYLEIPPLWRRTKWESKQVPLLPSSSAESDRSEMRSKYIHVMATMKKVKMLLATASLKLYVSPAPVELLGRCAMCFNVYNVNICTNNDLEAWRVKMNRLAAQRHLCLYERLQLLIDEQVQRKH